MVGTASSLTSVSVSAPLSADGLGSDAVYSVQAPVSHGMHKLGEHPAITPDMSRKILTGAL